jgi:transcriptional regulator with XRE-family HTH domain
VKPGEAISKGPSAGEFYVELGSRIARARKSHNLTQGELADLVQLTRTSITNIEKGRQKVLAHTVATLAAALSMDVAALMPATGRKSPVEAFAPNVQSSILKAVPELSQGGNS